LAGSLRCISWRSQPTTARRCALRDELTILGLHVDTRLTVVIAVSTMLLLFEEYRARVMGLYSWAGGLESFTVLGPGFLVTSSA
jgi:hypothetical protein